MYVEVTSDNAGLTYKRARTAEDRRRIAHEAAVLRQVAHPGIVQLLSTEGAEPVETLVLRTVDGGDLTTLGPEPMPVIAGLGAAVATTVADLHALGYCHGGIEASHVLLDEAGRPVLCSLGRATATAPEADRQHHDDLRALAVMLLQLIPPGGSSRVSRMLRGLATPSRRRPRRDAGWLARHLMSMVPDARLPGPDHAGGPAPASGSAGDDRPGRPAGPLRRITAVPTGRLVGVGAGFCLLVASVAVLVDRNATSAPSHRGPASDPSRAWASDPAAVPCPIVDHGCVPIPLSAGAVAGPAGRYALGQPGDVVVMGRWDCGPTAFPAVLRPGPGDVWTFDSWATSDDPVVGRLVGRVPSASSLRVLPGPSGCDALEVDRRSLPPVTIPEADR